MNADKAMVRRLDPIVWQALFQVRLPENRDQLTFEVPVSPKDWNRYWQITRAESRGYWHGAVGRIAERLGVSEDEWDRMVGFHQPEPPTCLGDSCLDYGYSLEVGAKCRQ